VCAYSEEGGHDPVLACLVESSDDETAFATHAEDISRLFLTNAGVGLRHVLPVRSIDRTQSGKVARNAISARFSRGDFADAIARVARARSSLRASQAPTAQAGHGRMPRVLDGLLAICRETLKDANLGLDDNLFDQGVNSLLVARIVTRVNEAFGCAVDPTELFSYTTVRELASHIAGLAESGALNHA